MSDLEAVLSLHESPKKKLLYGTAGFRDKWDILHSTCVRVGILGTLRSAMLDGQMIGIMITASHNPEVDNGIKIVDADGGMLTQTWEPLADALMNISKVEEAVEYINHIMELFPSHGTGRVILGRDTRPHSEELSACVKQGVSALHGVVYDAGIVTTPQLHYLVHHTNVQQLSHPVSMSLYYDSLARGFHTLLQLSTPSPVHIIIDASFGVGSVALSELLPVLHQHGVEITFDIRNPAGHGPVNHNCGAEYVQKGRLPPKGVTIADGEKIMCSVDGDADRIVFHAYLGNDWVLLDGDKIAALIAVFLYQELEAAALLSHYSFGVVQTAYANGASTIYLREKGLNIDFAKTGVKYVHEKAHRYDVGVYFEANGHGTAIFSRRITAAISAWGPTESVHPRTALAYKRLQAFMEVINPAVGDAISDMLACLAVLKNLDMNLNAWNVMYTDLASRQAKLPVRDKNAVKCSDDEMRIVTPAALQEELDGFMQQYPCGRCFVRPSGTEDVVRVYAETTTQDGANALAIQALQAVDRHIGATAEIPSSF